VSHYATQSDMATAFGVSKQCVGKWIKSYPDFPARDQHGFPCDAVQEWVDRLNERKAQREESTGNKDEKVRLECERLRVVIEREREITEQAKLETARQRGKMVLVSDQDRKYAAVADSVRQKLESLRSHETAKRPELVDHINKACDMVMAAMREAVE
jgi:small-conductance mechanosensitive channel